MIDIALPLFVISWHEERKLLNGFSQPDSIDADEAPLDCGKLGIFPLLAGKHILKFGR